MNSYIVIEPKDIDEKVLIFNFLGSKSISKFIVTDDLKEYVSEKFRVKFIEDSDSHMLTKHQSGVNYQNQQITAKSTNGPFDNIPSTDNVSLSTTGMNNMDTVMTDLVPKTEEAANSVVPCRNDIDNISLIDNTVSSTTAASNTNTGRLSTESGNHLNTRKYEDYGTYVPYRDRMVEPKEEVIDDGNGGTVNVNNTEDIITIVDDMSIDNVLIPNIDNQKSIEYDNAIDMEEQEVEDGNNSLAINDEPALIDTNTPSASTTRKSGRIVKRPRYTTDEDTDGKDAGSLNDTLPLDDSTLAKRSSGRVVKMPKYAMDDEDSDGEDDVSVTTNNDSTPKQQTKKKTSRDDGIQCQKCLRQLSSRYKRYSNAKEHATQHTDLMRYECQKKGCGYKGGYLQNIHNHFKTHHKGLPVLANKLDLTTEQEEELDKVTNDCFPVFCEPKKEKTCKLCQAKITDNRIDQLNIKRHALSHIDMMLYKCSQTNCCFDSRYYNEILKHGRKKHGIETMSKEDTAIELTDDQKKKIDKMFKKCFPEEEDGIDN